MEWCIDANIAVKAVVKEYLSEKARALIADASNAEVRLIAPHFFDAEVYSGEIAAKAGETAFQDLRGLPVQLLPTAHLLDRTWEIAKQFNLRWLYNAFYVALAEHRACVLWTADKELYEAVRDKLVFVKLLEDSAGRTS